MPESVEPRISLCIIARNEEANIVRCLASALPVVDEAIVMDTGSTDNTAALARSLGAAVHDYDWHDDFAAARMAGIAKATGDWIFVLDADEELQPESRAALRALVRDPSAQAYTVLRQEVERTDQTDGFITMRQLRLCRNDPSLSLVGRYHEHVLGDALEERGRRTGQKTLHSDILLRHWGYTEGKHSAKLARAAQILPQELAERPDQMYYEIELGRTWTQMGDPRGPKLLDDVFKRIVACEDSPLPPTPLAASVLERCLRLDAPYSPRVCRALRLAERWFSRVPPLVDAAAQVYYARGEFHRAIPLLERLVRMAETDDYDHTHAFPVHLLGDAPLLNLAVCCHRLARLDDAEYWYRRLLARTPGHTGALQNLAVLDQLRQLAA